MEGGRITLVVDASKTPVGFFDLSGCRYGDVS